MVEQEAVNFEVAGSSPAVGAIEKALGIHAWGFFYFFNARPDQQPQREAMTSCGSITRSGAGKFTYPNVTMIDGVVQPSEPR